MKKIFLITLICIVLLMLEIGYFTPYLMMQFGNASLIERMFRIFWLSSPLLFLFFSLRLIRIRPLFALVLSTLVLFSLTFISDKKQAITGVPLGFEDLVAGYNFSIAIKYLPTISYLIIFVVGIWLFALYHYEKKLFPTTRFCFSNLLFLLLLAPFSFYIYIPDSSLIEGKYYDELMKFIRINEIESFPGNWSTNVFLHGLPMHLIQTSSFSIPKDNVEQQQQFLAYNRLNQPTMAQSPKTIIYILCESCWYDQKHLRQLYQPLFDLGFAESRAISPVYGGGTANSEFEMLTGLPSKKKELAGIIYQGYAKKIRNNADTLPRHLRNNGYITYAGHNDIAHFYNRDIVYPKFDFAEYESIKDMGTLPAVYAKERKDWQTAADDYLLFNAAIKRLKAAHGQKIFMHLLTMSTHGEYHREDTNDDGIAAYSLQLKQSIRRMEQFFTQVEALDPNALIVIYGDHKPGLTDYFTKNHIMARNDIFGSPADYGDVPVLIKSSSNDKIQQLIKQSNHKPFYCLTNAVDSIFIGARPFSFKYMQDAGCLEPGKYDYNILAARAPGWLYALSLF